MFDRIRYVAAALTGAAMICGSAQGAVFLVDEDFSSGIGALEGAITANAGTGEYSIDGSTLFSNFNSGLVSIPIAYQNADFEFSVDFVGVGPAVGVADDDAVYLQIDLDGSNSGSAGFANASTTVSNGNITLSGNFGGASEFRALALFVDGGFGGTPGGTAGVALEVDNFQVYVVPEPASMALLGLGGLALIGRRRR